MKLEMTIAAPNETRLRRELDFELLNDRRVCTPLSRWMERSPDLSAGMASRYRSGVTSARRGGRVERRARRATKESRKRRGRKLRAERVLLSAFRPTSAHDLLQH